MNTQDFPSPGRFVWHSIITRVLIFVIFQTIVRAQPFPLPPDFISCDRQYGQPKITHCDAAIGTIPSSVPLAFVSTFQPEFPNHFHSNFILRIPTLWSSSKCPFQTASDTLAPFSSGYNSYYLPIVDSYRFADAKPNWVIRIETAPTVAAVGQLLMQGITYPMIVEMVQSVVARCILSGMRGFITNRLRQTIEISSLFRGTGTSTSLG